MMVDDEVVVDPQVAVRISDADPVKAEELLNQLKDLNADREAHYNIIKAFTQKTNFLRTDLRVLETVVDAYDNLKTIDTAIITAHMQWVNVSGKTDKQLDDEAHTWAPTAMYTEFQEFDDIEDAAKTKFRKILGDKQFESRDELKFLRKFNPNEKSPRKKKDVECKSNESSSSCESSMATKEKKLLLRKVPKEKQDIISKYTALLAEYNEKGEQAVSPRILMKKVEYLEIQHRQFQTYLDKYLLIPEITQVDYEALDTWFMETLNDILSLKCGVESKLEQPPVQVSTNPAGVVSQRKAQQMTLEKRKPPKFSGDVLDWLEFTKKWKSIVEVLSLDPLAELDLLKDNLPQEGKKKLHSCESLPRAWDILKKHYEDERLITSKLKSKLKNMQVKSKEEHEVVIEVFLEMEYLVSRLVALKAQQILVYDVDYQNGVYKLLPKSYQQRWDFYSREGFPNEWAAFQSFMNEIYNSAL